MDRVSTEVKFRHVSLFAERNLVSLDVPLNFSISHGNGKWSRTTCTTAKMARCSGNWVSPESLGDRAEGESFKMEGKEKYRPGGSK